MNRTVKESEAAKAFRRRKREKLKDALKKGDLRIEISNHILYMYYKGRFVGLTHTSHRWEVYLMFNIITNIMDGFHI